MGNRGRVPSDDGATVVAEAVKEVILRAGAVGFTQILMLSGIGPKSELEAVGVACRLDAAEVGKHLIDHLTPRPRWRLRLGRRAVWANTAEVP